MTIEPGSAFKAMMAMLNEKESIMIQNSCMPKAALAALQKFWMRPQRCRRLNIDGDFCVKFGRDHHVHPDSVRKLVEHFMSSYLKGVAYVAIHPHASGASASATSATFTSAEPSKDKDALTSTIIFDPKLAQNHRISTGVLFANARYFVYMVPLETDEGQLGHISVVRCDDWNSDIPKKTREAIRSLPLRHKVTDMEVVDLALLKTMAEIAHQDNVAKNVLLVANTKHEEFDSEMIILKPFECDHCHKPNVTLFRCSRCLKAQYCSKDCQTAQWANHRESCVPFSASVKGKDKGLDNASS
jgi:MYND finger